MEVLLGLILVPVAAAMGVILTASLRLRTLLIAVSAAVLAACTAAVFVSGGIAFAISHGVHTAIIVSDVLLLLFFAQQGARHGSSAVTLLAFVQLVLFALAEWSAPQSVSPVFIADDLSKWMFLIINGVGTLIALYAVRYMQLEAVSEARKRLFAAYLLLFLGVMNALVMANDLLLFFFLFEMTTLASYLLIGFRNDETARRNALRALWMNQVGGVAILLASLVAIGGFDTLAFDRLLGASGGYLLLAVAFLSMAAFVKGASMPFDSWLLGAMVAPTPVSAMLHSATMVKIAPFMILKLSSVLAGTLTGGVVSVAGAMVFVAASYLALSKNVFKEILGYSTIALLGLMMSLAAVGTEPLIRVAVLLMVFHALSKALLFLSAGVLEKNHRVKEIDAMKGLVERAPKSVGFILLGFVSLTLPPFGLFMGKLFALELLAAQLGSAPWLLIVLIDVAVGSVLLVLLYFKVASALLSKSEDLFEPEQETLSFGFAVPLYLLAGLIFAATAALLISQPGTAWYFLALPLAVVSALPWLVRRFERYDRVNEYRCGEKASFESALFYFGADAATRKRISILFVLLFAAIGLSWVFA